MRKSLLIVPVLLVIVFAAPAHAQYGPESGARDLTMVDNPLGDCSQAATADECMSLGWADPMAAKTDCSKIVVNGYFSCKSKCTCEFTNSWKKCDGRVCQEVTKADYKACVTQCEIDWI